MTKHRHWDEMYDKPSEAIPWEIAEPPHDLKNHLLRYKPRGSALDVGCGTGNYSLYLANSGFEDVVGIDLSATAIEIAKTRASKLSLGLSFMQADILQLDTVLDGKTFDFILDYSILHHIRDEDTAQYAKQCYKALKPGGRLLLVCYTENNEFASGESGAGKYGNIMYFRTADEVRQIYHDFSEISYKKSRLGKRGQHEAHSIMFTRN